MSFDTLRSPLTPEHLIQFQQIYRELRHERREILGGLPFGTNWLRMRYLKRNTIRTLATASWEPETLAIHRMAFDWSKPILLRGLIHHELLHFVLGPEMGHSDLFRTVEADWPEYPDYQKERRKFVRAIEDSAIEEGRLHRYICPNCHRTLFRARPMKPDSACSECCKAFNDGVWSESFTFITVGSETTTHANEEG